MSKTLPDDITAAVTASFAETPDPRLREIATALIRHLHAFVAEVGPTQQEWGQGIEFLTRVGHTCQGPRQEFILLSDVLGVSMLVDALGANDARATESTVLGPFYVDAPPAAEQGADLGAGAQGSPMWVEIDVVDAAGVPVTGAAVDVWQCDEDGLYDVQRDPSSRELRARFTTDDAGRVRFWSVVPVAYQIPSDGPVGDLLAATNRHPWRPAHIHFRIDAEGHVPLVTHLFVSGDNYLGSDAVFGVKPSLVVDLVQHGAGPAPDGREMKAPWHSLDYRFVLPKV